MRLLAIDQGTSATKALVVEPDGTVAAAAQVDVFPVTLPGGGVEQEPDDLWASVLAAGARAIADGGPVDAVALANQGETVLAWDMADGRARSRAISWQDRRAGAVCDRLRPYADELRALSGLPLDPYFAAPKMAWLREHGTPGDVVTTSDAWLLRRLTGSFVTDASTASRTMLLDLDTGGWSERAVEQFGLGDERLPRIAGNAEVVGETSVFGRSLPVVGLAVDQQAALFAHGCRVPGDMKCTYGTGAFLLAVAGEDARRSRHELSISIAWRLAGRDVACVDGQVYAVGSALRWLVEIGMLPRPDALDEVAATSPDAGGAIFVPGLAGLGAPDWESRPCGAFLGLGLATGRGPLARAVVEGIASAVARLAGAAADDLGVPLSRLQVDGGLTGSRALMQAQADLLGVPIEVAAVRDAAALGVAALGRIGLGVSGSDVIAPRPPAAVYEPAITRDQAEHRLARWVAAVTAARAWGGGEA